MPILDPSQCREFSRQDSDAPTWLIGLDYKPNPDVLVYAKYARGYRQGSTNPYSAEGYETFEPEKVDTYEAGAKLSFGGALPTTINFAAFYNNFSDQQLQTGFMSSQGGIAPNVAIVNVGKSRIYGAELEASLTPFRGFRLHGSYAYLKSKLKEVAPINIVPGSLYDIPISVPVAGQQLPLTPKHKFTIDAQYTLPLPEDIGNVRLGATWAYSGKQFNQTTSGANLAKLGSAEHDYIVPLKDPLFIESYSIVNFNMNWQSVQESNIDLQVFLNNAFNKRYFEAVGITSISQGFISRFIGQPRTYGARLRYSF